MEDIENKSYEDELNKAVDEISEEPIEYIPVPKILIKKPIKDDTDEEHT